MIATRIEKISRATSWRAWRQCDGSRVRRHQRSSLRSPDRRAFEAGDSGTMARTPLGRTIRSHQHSGAERVLLNATRKVKPLLSPDEAWTRVQRLLSWHPPTIDADAVRQARDVKRRYHLSWWDSLIVGAAQAQFCTVLLSEDMQDRAVYGGVTVRNPFTLGVSQAATEYAAPPATARPYRPRGRPKHLKPIAAAQRSPATHLRGNLAGGFIANVCSNPRIWAAQPPTDSPYRKSSRQITKMTARQASP